MNNLTKAAPMSFMAACLHYFGQAPGQTKLQFAQEVKQLTEEDRMEMKKELIQVGYNVN